MLSTRSHHSDESPRHEALGKRVDAFLTEDRVASRLTGRPMRNRRGSVTLEAILVIPILFITTLAVGQFFITSLVQQAALNASIEGAKVASKGGDADEVRDAVNEVLATVNVSIGTKASVIRETMAGLPEQRGTYTCTSPASPGLAADEIRVTVCIDMTAAPLLNALSSFGVNLTGKSLTTSTQMFIE